MNKRAKNLMLSGILGAGLTFMSFPFSYGLGLFSGSAAVYGLPLPYLENYCAITCGAVWYPLNVVFDFLAWTALALATLRVLVRMFPRQPLS
jgi:hypothetical protein